MSLNTNNSNINSKAIGFGVITRVNIGVKVIAIAFGYIAALIIDIVRGTMLLRLLNKIY